MRINIRTVFIFIFLTLSWCVTTSNAFALVCYQGSDTAAKDDKDALSVIAYMGDKTLGERIWTSKVFTRNITCRSELELSSQRENVYIYPYPKRNVEQLPAGVKMGLIFNGVDLGTFDTSSSIEAGRVDTAWSVNQVAATRTMTFQVYLVRTGEISSSGVNEVTLFQLDGVGGLNTLQSNYNISLSGWNNIGSVTCYSIPRSAPATLDFKTSDILNGESSETASNVIGMYFNCGSTPPNIINYVKSVGAIVTFNGTPSSINSQYFSTNIDNLALEIKSENRDIHPGSKMEFSFPLSSGTTTAYIPLEITPRLSSFSLNQPSWLFSDGAIDIYSLLPHTYTINGISTH